MGPLSDLTKSGRAFVDTFRAGMGKAAPIEVPFVGAMQMPAVEVPALPAMQMPAVEVPAIPGMQMQMPPILAPDVASPQSGISGLLDKLTGFLPDIGNRLAGLVPSHMQAAMAGGLMPQQMGGLLTPLPVGPLPAAAPSGGMGGGPVEINLTIERIEISAAGGDVQDIGEQIGEVLQQQLRAVVEEFDNRIRA